MQHESHSVVSKNSLNQSNEAFALKTNELPTTLPPMSEETKALEEPLLKVEVADTNAVGDNYLQKVESEPDAGTDPLSLQLPNPPEKRS